MPDEPYTVLADGCASISCVNTGTGQAFMALIGPRVTHLRPPFSKGTRIWGIRLWPDAIGPALGVPARSLRDWFGALPRDGTRRFNDLHRAIPPSDDPDDVFPVLDTWVTSTLHDAPAPDPRVRAAIRGIVRRRGEGSMENVAREASIGLRQLQRLFPDATGLTLREYARVRRLREALAMRLAPTAPGWSRIAAETGFVDHSHLTREFIALGGVAPTAAAEQLRTTLHVEVQP